MLSTLLCKCCAWFYQSNVIKCQSVQVFEWLLLLYGFCAFCVKQVKKQETLRERLLVAILNSFSVRLKLLPASTLCKHISRGQRRQYHQRGMYHQCEAEFQNGISATNVGCTTGTSVGQNLKTAGWNVPLMWGRTS